MASRLNPYLNFQDDAREAMEFYRDVFGGELTINTFGETMGPDAPNPDQVMHSHLETPAGFTLMAADTGEGRPIGNMNIVVSGGEAEELRGYWHKLAEGGSVAMALEKQVWGDEFGEVVDRFGVPWAFNIDLSREA